MWEAIKDMLRRAWNWKLTIEEVVEGIVGALLGLWATISLLNLFGLLP